MAVRRRELLRGLVSAACTGWAMGGGAAGCRPAERENGRTVATLWFSYGGKNREVLLDLVARFNARQTRTLIKATYQGDYFEALAKLRTAVAAGVVPTFSHVVGEVLPYLAGANVLEPLDGYADARTIPYVAALAQSGSFRGGESEPLVAVPFNRSTPIMYLNGAVLERELKGHVPSTWDELADAALRLTRRGDRTRWGYEVPIAWWFWVAMVGQAGGGIVGADGTPTLGGEAGAKALRFWQRLVHVDRSMRPPPGRDFNAWQATNEDFLAERVAITWTSTAFLRYLEENARFPVIAAPLPRDVRRSVPTGGTFFVILRSAPQGQKEAAWEFLRWMSEPEQAIDWATRTGYLPITEGAVERLSQTGYYAAHPNDLVAYRQLADAEPWPWAPNLFRIERDVVEPRLEDAVLRNRDAAMLLDEARADARMR